MNIIKLKNCIYIAVICSFILTLLLYAGFFSNIQLKLSDNLYGGKAPLDAITIVAIDDKSLQEIGRWPWNRTVFATTIQNINSSKTIGIDVAFFEESEEDETLGAVLSEKIIIPIEFTSFAKENDKIIGKRILKPVPELNKAQTGYVNIVTDKDGVTRAVNMDISDEHENFAQAVYKHYWGKELPEKSSRFLVNFVGEPGSFKYYSLTDVYNGRTDPDEFKNKLVLIGATSPDMHDDYFVPTSKGKAMPGVEIHANTIQTMINKDFLQEQPKWSVVLLMLIISLLIAFAIYKFRIKITTIIVPIILIACLFLAIYAFEYGVIMNLVFVPLAIVSTYTFEVVYLYSAEKKEREKTMGAFSKYVSPAVVDELMKDPSKLKLGGARKEITVFFSDIRGFTTISEKLSPEKLVHILNEYLTAMTDIVMKHEGVVDKYIGDAIMAFWGAPMKQPNHAEMACSTSVDMIKKLGELQKKWAAEKFPEIKIGIGLNTGHAVIGNMGSYERFDYTAMGDTINLGSRLEGLTKVYGVNILASESTKKAAKGFVFRKLDLVRVKGKNKPITIYELVCRAKEEHDADKIKAYETGLKLYLDKKWDKAIKEFEKAKDFAAKEFIKRCKEFKKNPPPKEWDGVWVMKTK
ncbi:adenylate/guanylate cyclase domain-containing protein [Candidatus Woesearchaeota archaeon]|nr:adenylate/guanylate cyclase domain-containing protein [Candidatus Woesearchaeota archaeon]MBW3006281.1 adenylate/guanylate cyclase domain-containing protein [Candidatus Woesearchaeota archaeon]